MKLGANTFDQEMIRRMMKGVPETDEHDEIKPKTAAQISKALQIEVTCVESFVKKFKAEK